MSIKIENHRTIVLDICFQRYYAAHVMKKHGRYVSDINPRLLHTLRLLASMEKQPSRKEPPSMAELAGRLGITVSTTWVRLRKLRDKGLVHWGDQTRREMQITEAGYAVIAANRGKWGR